MFTIAPYISMILILTNLALILYHRRDVTDQTYYILTATLSTYLLVSWKLGNPLLSLLLLTLGSALAFYDHYQSRKRYGSQSEAFDNFFNAKQVVVFVVFVVSGSHPTWTAA